MEKNRTISILIGIIVLLVITFFIGRCTNVKDKQIITVTIPEKSGSSPITINPKPIITTKDSLIYRDTVIKTENPYNKVLAQEYIDLEKRYANIELEKERLKKYLETIQIRDYEIPFEDNDIKIINKIKAQGEIISFQQDYKIKEKKVTTEVPIKSKVNLYGGVEIGNNKDFNQFVTKANIMLQNKKGDIINVSYDTDKRFWVGYAFKLN